MERSTVDNKGRAGIPVRTIGVSPVAALTTRSRLLRALEDAFPVRFAPWNGERSECDGLLSLRGAAAAHDPEPVTGPALPVLAVEEHAGNAREPRDVVLSHDPAVDRRLGGLSLPSVVCGPPLNVPPGETALAAADDGPVWTTAGGPARVERLRAPLSELGPSEALREALAPHRALPLLALIQFVRRLGEPDAWRPPPLRATFVFDDPNLRRPRYGFVDYTALVDHADEHSYHASMAMIPLDARRSDPRSVSLFRRRSDRLSLCVHGNNHVKRELMGPADLATALALGAQAIRRVALFETRTGLPVDRVMAPPHGTCSRTFAQALGALGFDAASTIHAFPWTEQPPASRPLAGWHPAEFQAGCAVVPRLPLTCSAAEIAVRAFLDHPLTLYGHHDDLASGLDPLALAAERVKRLGDVRWTSLGDAVLENHSTRTEGEVTRVRPFARRIRVDLPDDARLLAVEAPEPLDEATAFRGWRLDGGPLISFGELVPRPPGPFEVRLVGCLEVDPSVVGAPRWRPWPVLRRRITETRDRVRPLLAGSTG